MCYKLKMEFIGKYTLKTLLIGSFIIAAILCAARLTSVNAAEKNIAQSTPHPQPADANETPTTVSKEENSKQVETALKDPNDIELADEPDLFEPKLSTFVLINEAYDRIFTPELITEDGRVDYFTLKRRRWDVLTAQEELKNLNPAVLMSLTRDQRIAFWINTYNFCTISLILNEYPIEPKWYMIIYPDNSIMQITGAWTKVFFEIQQLEYNLTEIEQDFLLKRYNDPRICFALSNASAGGPILRNEPYSTDHLYKQIEEQIKKYLSTPKGMRLDKENNILHLSNIFQVHTKTFLESDLVNIKKFRDRKDQERVWLNFILPYLSKEDVRYLEDNEVKIKFIDFDWHLNDASKQPN